MNSDDVVVITPFRLETLAFTACLRENININHLLHIRGNFHLDVLRAWDEVSDQRIFFTPDDLFLYEKARFLISPYRERFWFYLRQYKLKKVHISEVNFWYEKYLRVLSRREAFELNLKLEFPGNQLFSNNGYNRLTYELQSKHYTESAIARRDRLRRLNRIRRIKRRLKFE